MTKKPEDFTDKELVEIGSDRCQIEMTRRLTKSIKEFNEKSSRYSKRLITLTIVIVVLTAIIIFLTAVMIFAK